MSYNFNLNGNLKDTMTLFYRFKMAMNLVLAVQSIQNGSLKILFFFQILFSTIQGVIICMN